MIFGDPSDDIRVGSLISVLLYVPDKEGKLTGVHWISSFWLITGVSHSIGGGTFTTTLDLTRSSFAAGSVQSKAMYNMAYEDLGEGGG